MALNFEWDANKAKSNLVKHPRSLTIPDPVYSELENRLITVGSSHRGKLLVVVHTDRGDNIRIISARMASRRERRSYEEST
jgi:hypothetical protein